MFKDWESDILNFIEYIVKLFYYFEIFLNDRIWVDILC